MTITNEELKTRFTYHAPKNAEQIARYQDLRELGHSMAAAITLTTPESREQSLALTKLEEAVMWANAAIARRESG